MNVLWLSHFVPYPPAGGALQRSFHLLQHVASHHDVHLVALNQPRLLSTDAQVADAVDALSSTCASVRVFALPSERSSTARLTTLAASVFARAPFDVVWLRSHEMSAEVARFRERGDIDLVHVDTIGLWPYAEGWTGTPRVLGHHNIESDLIARRAAREPQRLKSIALRRDAAKLLRLEQRAAPRASVNVVVSELEAEHLMTIAPASSIEVVDNGVDTSYWTPGENAPTPRSIAFAGTLGWYPNREAIQFLLSEIWPTLLATNPERRLTLVGRDPPPEAIAATSDARVRTTGFVPDVRPYLRDATVFVCPIRVGGGTRLKVLDALALAKPVVATAIGVEGLGLVEGEHYLGAETASEFAAQIDRLERDPELARRIGRAGRALVVSRFDWRVIGLRLDTAYARALANSDRAVA